ncbi:hypothetical protein GQ42DRAFT_70213, partial [Ramicandelaber brevisporus]
KNCPALAASYTTASSAVTRCSNTFEASLICLETGINNVDIAVCMTCPVQVPYLESCREDGSPVSHIDFMVLPFTYSTSKLNKMIAEPDLVSLLFSLPRELQELITEFFARQEAVPTLTVNKAFHELFAERIWRRLDKSVSYNVSMPQEALKTYGHLVRCFKSQRNIPISDDLLSTFPNLTHLWIPYYQLKNVIVAAQGKPLERLQCLELSFYKEHSDMHNTTVDDDPVIQWLSLQVDNCSGKLTIEWRMHGAFALQDSPKLMPWLKSQSEKAQLCFKIENDVIDFGDTNQTDTNGFLLRHLVDFEVGPDDEKCGTERLGRLLTSIPLNKRKTLNFPVLKKLKLHICCDSSSEICSQFDFGSLFPAVQELKLNADVYQCAGGADIVLKSIFASPWPSVRKLVVEGALFLDKVTPHLSTLPNVEHLTMYHDTLEVDEVDESDLRDIGDALPKLAHLSIAFFYSSSGYLMEMPHKSTGDIAALKLSPFLCLRSIELEAVKMTPYTLMLLVQAPVLTEIHLIDATFAERNSEVGISEQSSDGTDCLGGIVNSTVHSFKFIVDKYTKSEEYEAAIGALLKCFVRLAVCTAVNVDKEVLGNYRKDFPAVKFVKSSSRYSYCG